MNTGLEVTQDLRMKHWGRKVLDGELRQLTEANPYRERISVYRRLAITVPKFNGYIKRC